MANEFTTLLHELEEQCTKLEFGIININAINIDMTEENISLKTAADALFCPVDYLWTVHQTIKQLVVDNFKKAGYNA